MEQLLKITNIPIKIELKVNNARLYAKNTSAQLEISRDKGGLRIRSHPIRLNIDTFEARNSVVPTTRRSIEQAAAAGIRSAYEATARYAKEGQLLLSAKLGDDALDYIMASRMEVPTDFELNYLPSVPPDLNWSEPDLTITYEMDKLNFEWKVLNGNFEFIPGDIEVAVTQRPDVIIEYVGKVLYVPPSAEPGASASVDVKA